MRAGHTKSAEPGGNTACFGGGGDDDDDDDADIRGRRGGEGGRARQPAV